MKYSIKQSGFTLIEVVIATFIVGLTLVALAGTVQSITQQTSNIQDTYFANLIANNVLTEHQLMATWPDVDETNDIAVMADRDWTYTVRVIATEVESLRRIEVEVSRENEPDRISASLVGFVGVHVQLASSQVVWVAPNDEQPTDTEDGDEL